MAWVGSRNIRTHCTVYVTLVLSPLELSAVREENLSSDHSSSQAVSCHSCSIDIANWLWELWFLLRLFLRAIISIVPIIPMTQTVRMKRVETPRGIISEECYLDSRRLTLQIRQVTFTENMNVIPDLSRVLLLLLLEYRIKRVNSSDWNDNNDSAYYTEKPFSSNQNP